MQTMFSVVLLFFTVLILWANPKEKVNRWCSASLLFFFLGVLKQAIMFEIIPEIQNWLGVTSLQDRFALWHNVFTWAIYSLAMPTMTIGAFYFGYIDLDKKSKILKYLIYLPCLLLLPFFSPARFVEYQLYSIPFWIVYTSYNFSFGIILTAVVVRGILIDRQMLDKGSILTKKKNRRRQEAMVMLPSLFYWLLSIFPVHLLNVLGFDVFGDFLQLWQLNLILLTCCIIGALALAVTGRGFFGVNVIPARYSSTQRMHNDEFMSNFSHRIKSDTTYMGVAANKIKDALSQEDADHMLAEIQLQVEELTGEISTLNKLSRRYNRYANQIELEIKTYRLKYLIDEAVRSDARIYKDIDENVFIECDGGFIVEVFKDIIDNGIHAIQTEYASEQSQGRITITAGYDINRYKIMFTDNGVGIPSAELENIFEVGITTKNKEFNSGLGLANCRKVINAHGWKIYAQNNEGDNGATIVVELPLRAIKRCKDGSEVCNVG